jgi:hypothetical protein
MLAGQARASVGSVSLKAKIELTGFSGPVFEGVAESTVPGFLSSVVTQASHCDQDFLATNDSLVDLSLRESGRKAKTTAAETSIREQNLRPCSAWRGHALLHEAVYFVPEWPDVLFVPAG